MIDGQIRIFQSFRNRFMDHIRVIEVISAARFFELEFHNGVIKATEIIGQYIKIIFNQK